MDKRRVRDSHATRWLCARVAAVAIPAKGASMDFKFNEEDEALRRDFRSWLEKNLPRDWHDEGELHDPDTKEEFERRRAWHRKLYDGGWMCIHWPKEYGGGRAGRAASGRSAPRV